MTCYRKGGCGPYEMLPCGECPASKPEYLNRYDDPKPELKEKMNEVRINLNEDIKVKLTDLGKDIYYHQFDEFNRFCGKIVCEPSFPKEDAEGYTKFQLWNFMEIYGEYIGMARPNVIEPLEIIYELPKEEA